MPAKIATVPASPAIAEAGAAAAARLALPPCCMFFLSLWGIAGPSYWRDEAATLSAVTRPFPVLLHMLGKTDVVHSVYYFMMWPLVHLLGTSEVVVRMPSAIAAAIAAGGVSAIGRRLASDNAGLVSGLVFAVLPVTLRYGQEARSYALVMALGVTATYLLIRAFEQEAAARWLAGYSVTLAFMAWLHLMSLALLAAHSVTIAARHRHTRIAVPFAAAIALASLSVVPLVVLAWFQRHGTERFLGPTNLRTIGDALAWLTGSWLTLIVAVPLMAIAVRAAKQYPDLLWVCLPWLLVPPLTLALAGAFYPVYDSRYILYCVPPVSLLTGLGADIAATWLPGKLRVLAMAPKLGLALAGAAAVAALGVPSQLADRSAGGHGDNIRLAAEIVALNQCPGDAVLYAPAWWRQIAAAYPYGFSQLRDISLRDTPDQAGNFTGTQFPPVDVRRRLADVYRVWLVEYLAFRPSPDLGKDWTAIQRWRASPFVLTLYQAVSRPRLTRSQGGSCSGSRNPGGGRTRRGRRPLS